MWRTFLVRLYSYQNDGSLGQVVRVVPELALFLSGIRHGSVKRDFVGRELQKKPQMFFNVFKIEIGHTLTSTTPVPIVLYSLNQWFSTGLP